MTTATQRTEHMYDQEDILATFDDAARPPARYTHGPGIDEPLAELRGPTMLSYRADTFGTIIFNALDLKGT